MRLHVFKETKSFRCGLSLVSAAVFCLSSFSGSAQAATDTGTADAYVVSPISVTTLNPFLSFGTLASRGISGTVELDPDTAILTPIGVDLLGGNLGAVSLFKVSGETGQNYNITFPLSITIDNGSSGDSNKMEVDLFTSVSAPFGSFPASGDVFVSVGATLNVKAVQNVGDYSGNYILTALYQ